MSPEEQAFLDQLRRVLAEKVAPLAAETDAHEASALIFIVTGTTMSEMGVVNKSDSGSKSQLCLPSRIT